MMKQLLFFGLALMLAVVQAKHIHPHLITDFEDGGDTALYPVDTEGNPIDLREINRPRFVPLNNAFFFKLRQPCQDGFQRDILGVCREVW